MSLSKVRLQRHKKKEDAKKIEKRSSRLTLYCITAFAYKIWFKGAYSLCQHKRTNMAVSLGDFMQEQL